MELIEYMDTLAFTIAESGTLADRRTLEILAAAVGSKNQGAAAALVDWDGSEIARLRAFGIVHGIVVHELSRDESLDLAIRLNPIGAFALVA